MDTEQSREILNAVETQQRAELNLRNAAAMASDDPRSKELLESAGDSYAEATLNRRRAEGRALKTFNSRD